MTVTTLDNGLRIVTERNPSVETTTLGLWVDAGSRIENEADGGIAHMLEHMVFKGTGRRSAQAIATEIEDVGGHLNAYTGREHTGYYAKVLKEDIGLAIDLTTDLVFGATLDSEELERERTVVLQEIGQAHDTPDDIIFDHFQETAYPNQPLGRPVLGTVESVRALGRRHPRRRHGGRRFSLLAGQPAGRDPHPGPGGPARRMRVQRLPVLPDLLHRT